MYLSTNSIQLLQYVVHYTMSIWHCFNMVLALSVFGVTGYILHHNENVVGTFSCIYTRVFVSRFYRFYFEADFLLWKSTGCRDTEVCDKIVFFISSKNKCYFYIVVLDAKVDWFSLICRRRVSDLSAKYLMLYH